MKHDKTKNSNVITGDLRVPLSKKVKNALAKIKPRSKKQAYLLGGVALLLVAGLTGYFLVWKKDSSNQVAEALVCDAPMIREGMSRVATFNVNVRQTQGKKIDGIYKAANHIRTLSNYEKDPDCLHLLTQYYVTVGNAAEARTYFNQRLTWKDAKTSELLGELEELRVMVEAVEQQAKETESNIRFIQENPDAPTD